jgi:hypothetical protein
MKTQKFQNYEIRETGNNAAVYLKGTCIGVINIKSGEIAFKTISLNIEEVADLMEFVNDFYGQDSKQEYAVHFEQGWNSVYASNQIEAERLAKEEFEQYGIIKVQIMTEALKQNLLSLFY